MAILKEHQADVRAIVGKRNDNGANFWATADGRWGKGSPFSTFDCVLTLTELGMKKSDPVLKGAASVLLNAWQEDGRIGPAPKGAVYPCHTANAARVLCRLGYAKDLRLKRTFEHLLEVQHDDGGWRCNTVKLGKSPETDASNPGVTLSVLDAFRFTLHLNEDKRLDRAVKSLLSHWTTRVPLGPCHFGIGTLFGQVEYPFLRYNLFFYVYVLSFFERAKSDTRFRAALEVLQSKLNGDDQVVVERPHRGLKALELCAQGRPSELATGRYRELCRNLE